MAGPTGNAHQFLNLALCDGLAGGEKPTTGRTRCGPMSVQGPGRVKTFFLPQKLHDPRGRDRLSIFLLYRVWSQSGSNLMVLPVPVAIARSIVRSASSERAVSTA